MKPFRTHGARPFIEQLERRELLNAMGWFDVPARSDPRPAVDEAGCDRSERAEVCGRWEYIPSPNADPTLDRLLGVAAVSENEAWAVGATCDQTLIEHWDGTSWTVVPSPSPGTGINMLEDVAVVSATDVWAVGHYSDIGPVKTLIEHWDGVSWSAVASPQFPFGATLYAVAVVAANDIWAVGAAHGGTRTVHWDGSTWEVVPSPGIPATQINELNAVSIIASDDILAVAASHDLAHDWHTLTIHWDGTSWTHVPSPNIEPSPPKPKNYLFAVAAVSSNDVWVSGIGLIGVKFEPLFLHWDGSSWEQVFSPGGVPVFPGGRAGLAVLAPDDIYAVGTTIARWDCASWSLVPGAKIPGRRPYLTAASVVGSCDIWAVGSFLQGNRRVTLTERLQPERSNSIAPHQAVHPTLTNARDAECSGVSGTSRISARNAVLANASTALVTSKINTTGLGRTGFRTVLPRPTPKDILQWIEIGFAFCPPEV